LSFLCFSIMLILFNRSGLSLSFEIWLSDGIEKVGVVTIPVNDVFSIIAFGPLLSLIFYFCFKRASDLLKRLQQITDNRIRLMRFLLILNLIFLNMGIFTNRLFNLVSNQLKAHHDLTEATSGVFVWTYFLDEYVGHHLMNVSLIMIPLIMALLRATAFTCESDERLTLNGGEVTLVIITSLIYGVFLSLEFLEGQSTYCVLFGIVLLLGVFLVFKMKKQKISLKYNPFLMFNLITIITMTIFYLVFGMIFGVKSIYPYFYQPSEL
ncbi:MAG: hypothetical protein ACTSRA_10525, partial [Promethearchaeota archaeon]